MKVTRTDASGSADIGTGLSLMDAIELMWLWAGDERRARNAECADAPGVSVDVIRENVVLATYKVHED